MSKHNWVPQNGVSIGGVSINSKQGDTNKTNRRSNADDTRRLLYFVKVLQDLGACSSHAQASHLEPECPKSLTPKPEDGPDKCPLPLSSWN